MRRRGLGCKAPPPRLPSLVENGRNAPMKCAAVISGCLLLAGCSKTDARYELVRVEDKVIRLDRKTGQLISINAGSIAKPIDTASASESHEVDKELAVPKVIERPLSGFPGGMTLKLEYRWMKGALHHRMTITPLRAELVALNHADDTRKSNHLEVVFFDQHGFEVAADNPNFLFATRSAGNPEGLRISSEVSMTKADFLRIASVGFSTNLSADLKTALSSKP